MNKKILICPLLILFYSCGTMAPVIYEYHPVATNMSDEELRSPSILPRVNLFLSAPYLGQTPLAILEAQIIFPTAQLPPLPPPPVPKGKIREAKVLMVVPSVEAAVDLIEDQEKVAGDPVGLEDESNGQSELLPEVLMAEPVEPILRQFSPLEPVRIELEGLGWIFVGELSGQPVLLKERIFGDQSTIFTFLKFDKEKTLRFSLQDGEGGESESVLYKLSPASGEEKTVVLGPVIIDPQGIYDGPERGQFASLLATENIPSIISSFSSLLDQELSKEELLHLFDLLERQGGYDRRLSEVAKTYKNLYGEDGSAASLLFRAAQGLEKPGRDQDIEGAIELFVSVRDLYPLDPLSEQSDQRIRYLDRHFRKIF